MKKKIINAVCIFVSALLISSCSVIFLTAGKSKNKDFIRYAEFNVTYYVLKKTMELDIETYNKDKHFVWTDTLAYLAAKYGGDFSRYSEKDLTDYTERIRNGESAEKLSSDMKYYSYFRDVYTAVLGGMLGEFTETGKDGKTVKKYGLKAYYPIAAGFALSEYDDFGASRSYGYKRKHLGHDIMCETGTPIICTEDGTVECIGWNQYGGWRIGIRSNDKKRYYYYAHLRQNRPYHSSIVSGGKVKAGQVIGYAGRTGYSVKENVNNIETPHLHFGLELVFDESQKESDNEIWIDLYALSLLLSEHKAKVVRDPETKEFNSDNQF